MDKLLMNAWANKYIIYEPEMGAQKAHSHCLSCKYEDFESSQSQKFSSK